MMDKTEFSRRVLECEKTLYRVAKGILGRESDCEDAVQEAILKAYTSIGTLREPCYFTTWLVRITINECKMMLRKRAKSEFSMSLDEFEAAEAATPENGSDGELYCAIAQLELPLRLAVVLHYVEGYSVKECSKMMAVPCGTVKTRLMRARSKLKKTLGFND